jgi:phosphate transport system substrate-binding protein
MKFKSVAKSIVAAAAVAVLAFSMVGCANSESANSANSDASSSEPELSGTISTNGSTSMEKIIGSLSEAFMQENPGVTISYDATGSGTGIECAGNGSTDIGLASRDLKDGEDGLNATPVALDGIAIIVNPESGVEDLSLEQVSDIFTGKITNYKDVGGNDLEISCVGRENGSGTRDGFESITGTEGICTLDQELTSTGAVITAVSSSKNAIGYASLSSVEGNEGIAAVTIDGVTCSEDTVKDGSYKIQRPFNFIVKEGTQLSPQAQAFIDFATSPEASELIRDAGVVPVA